LNFGTRRLQAHVFDRCLSVSHIHNCIRTLRYQSYKLHERCAASYQTYSLLTVGETVMFHTVVCMSECCIEPIVCTSSPSVGLLLSCSNQTRMFSVPSLCLSVCLSRSLASVLVCEVAHAPPASCVLFPKLGESTIWRRDRFSCRFALVLRLLLRNFSCCFGSKVVSGR